MCVAWIVAALLVATPEFAQACAVCTGGQTEEVRYAFIWTTGFLSVLPVALVGGLIWYLRRRVRELAAQEQPAGTPAPAPTEAPAARMRHR